MKILALIPARGKSKRLPGKNIKMLGGKPLIVWSINAAKSIPEICDILVSTDDPRIASIAKNEGAVVPWLRPKKLACDSANSVDVALHAVDWYQKNRCNLDGIILLQPTSPFRTKKTIRSGIFLYIKYDRKPVLGVSLCHAHPMWALKKEGSYLVPFISKHGMRKRSQDLPPAYVLNGSFYLISPAELRASKSFIGSKSVPLLIKSQREALEIDTKWDFKIAKSIL